MMGAMAETMDLAPRLIDGKALADRLLADLSAEVSTFAAERGYRPTLALIQVGDDPASSVYVRRKREAAARVGVSSVMKNLSADASQQTLLDEIAALNADSRIHGILVQLPLPRQMQAAEILDSIRPDKDVDGFHPVNIGRLSVGSDGLVPCTPLGCLKLLETVINDFRGLKAVVIGKSNIVGKPVSLLLLEKGCTVTVAHILTRNLPAIVCTADIVVVAAGSPGLLRGGWVKPGAIVIDVGINEVPAEDGRRRIVGDAVFNELGHAGAITPVPGGVGPMTVACLLSNTVHAARMLAEQV